MKKKMKYYGLILGFALALSACGSGQSNNSTADSLDSVEDSIRNDTSSYDITSQRDSTDTAGSADTTIQ